MSREEYYKIFTNSQLSKIVSSGGELLDIQTKMLETQTKILETQNKILEVQYKIFEKQKEYLIQSDIVSIYKQTLEFTSRDF